MQGHIDFENRPWPSITNSAKDLVRRMLIQDPKKRITATQVLGKSLHFYFVFAFVDVFFRMKNFLRYGFIISLVTVFYVLYGLSEHPWLKEGGSASDKPIDSAVLSRMKQFRAMNKLKKLALKVSPVAIFTNRHVDNYTLREELNGF